VAYIRRDIPIDADPEAVWSAVRDVGAVHRRLAPGFVVDTVMDGDARIVTFANGLVARELIVDIDDGERRLAYAAVGGLASHHHAVLQVVAGGERRCRLVWVTDVLPDEVAGPVGQMVDAGAAVMQRTLEALGAVSG
jgi:Polyketide cyclase / dehydrase and lipid transport